MPAARAPIAANRHWHTYTENHLALMEHLGHRRFHPEFPSEFPDSFAEWSKEQHAARPDLDKAAVQAFGRNQDEARRRS